MPQRHIVNYSSLAGPSRITTTLEINRHNTESHLNQEGRLGPGLPLSTAASHRDAGAVELSSLRRRGARSRPHRFFTSKMIKNRKISVENTQPDSMNTRHQTPSSLLPPQLRRYQARGNE